MNGASGDEDRAAPGAARTRRLRRIGRFMMQVLWPAFLMAVVAEGVFFSLIDPRELGIVGTRLADSREAAYTIGFFVFWLLFACSSGITYALSHGIGESPDGGHEDER